MSGYNDLASLYNVIGTTFSGDTILPNRPRYVYDALCKARTWNLNTTPNAGDAVTFPVLGAWSTNTVALSGTITSFSGGEQLAYTRKSITLAPYGNFAAYDMMFAKTETFTDDIADMAFSLNDQAQNSMNLIARTKMDLNRFSNGISGGLSATSNLYASYSISGATVSMGPLKAKDIRKLVANAKTNKVRPFPDGFFYMVVTSAQKTQLRADTDVAGWTASSVSNANGDMLKINGDIGVFEGVRFIVSDENKKLTNTHFAYFLGDDAIGKAIGIDTSVKTNPTLAGPYANILTMYWAALLGYSVIRPESLIVVQSKTTLM
jgi:N4-gp56 family major capsid protein